MLDANLESPLPGSLTAGTAIALYCSGTASADGAPVGVLELELAGDRVRPEAVAMPRFDALVRRSGFWALVDVRAPRSGAPLELRAHGAGQEPVVLGRIDVSEPQEPQPLATPAPPGLIAICMGTFDPQPELFRAQLESLRAQSDQRWVCVVSDDCSSPERFELVRAEVGDDERFIVSRSAERIGFYRNFERALTLAPREAELFAFCDQDDVWHPDKLAVLRGGIRDAALVYSDLRLVDERGVVLRDTLWRGRSNNSTNLASMLVANTVTGAAALFRREVVELALPFPDSPGIEFHDHWIALVALTSGELAYVDRPLYDYVQHSQAILGKVAGPDGVAAMPRRRLRARDWRAAYFLGYVPGQVRARTLLLRCEDRVAPAKRRALERYLKSGSSLGSFVWFVLRPLRALVGRSETLGGEWELARGILWRWLAGLSARMRWWPDRLTLDCQFPDPPHFEHRRLRRWRGRI